MRCCSTRMRHSTRKSFVASRWVLRSCSMDDKSKRIISSTPFCLIRCDFTVILIRNGGNFCGHSQDHILRYGGVYTIALAYAGTADNEAVRKLLHVAVSDTSDDVRRAAVTSLAFLLFKNPSQVPRLVQLLSESYNPHVRCGATLALGIACAGTGLQVRI